MADKPHWFPFFPNDFLSSSRIALMSTEEIGAYILLLCHAWNDPTCSLPDNDEDLAKLGRIKGDVTNLRACFLAKRERLINERLYKEWQKTKEIQSVRSISAKKANAIRWGSQGDPSRIANGSQTDPILPSQLQSEKKKKRGAPLRAVDPAVWLEELRKNPAYQHINFAAELHKMDAWLTIHPTRKKTKAFILNWLNKIEPPLVFPARKERLPL